jgi:acetyltransferase-like isoleucine patch superfamily enzyme
MTNFINLIVALIPVWPLKRFILCYFYGYSIHKNARIGFALCFPERLIMGDSAYIGDLTVVKGLEQLIMGDHASIGRLNWISGYNPKVERLHYRSLPYRKSELILGQHSAITNRHLIDCTDTVEIGEFATIAGFNSQILTHSINMAEARQSAIPLRIGKYCFLGSKSLILSGASIADFSIVGAGSIVTKPLLKSYVLYAGSPAKRLKDLDQQLAYFQRKTGYIT